MESSVLGVKFFSIFSPIWAYVFTQNSWSLVNFFSPSLIESITLTPIQCICYCLTLCVWGIRIASGNKVVFHFILEWKTTNNLMLWLYIIHYFENKRQNLAFLVQNWLFTEIVSSRWQEQNNRLLIICSRHQAFKISQADSCTSGIVVCLENSKWDKYFTIKSSILLNF